MEKIQKPQVGLLELISYIIHFANAVKLYQKKNQNYYGCGSPGHLMRWSSTRLPKEQV